MGTSPELDFNLPGSGSPITLKEVEIVVNPSKSPVATGLVQNAIPAVKAMQQAMIFLAKDIASHDIHLAMEHINQKGESLSGADPFNDFLVENYLNKSKIVGKQVANISSPQDMKSAQENNNIQSVLASIMRIGGVQNEQQADGVWGPKTQNAIRQVYALATALMRLPQDLHMSIKGYSDTELQEFASHIPASEQISIEEKSKFATALTQDINKVRGLYDAFRTAVLDNQQYRAQIVQGKALVKTDHDMTPATNRINLADKDLYEKHKSQEIDIKINDKNISIMPFNLSTMENFKTFLLKNSQLLGLTPQQQTDLKNNNYLVTQHFLSEILPQLQES